MKLHITYSDKPDFPGFTYPSSEQSRRMGPDAEKRELLGMLNFHLTRIWRSESDTDWKDVVPEVSAGEINKRPRSNSTAVAVLQNDDGTEIEKVPITKT